MNKFMKSTLSLVLILATLISCIVAVGISTSAADVNYKYSGDYIYNWGTRGETATFLSPNAEKFYQNNTSYDVLSSYSGGTSSSNAPSSPLYKALQKLMKDNHDNITSYNETKDLYQYTDCQNNGGKISSFYSGKAIGPSWNGSWNREHTWPNSKGLGGSDENDIMMLRPTSTSENSSRGNTAYGQSSGYYHPNSESDGEYDLRGDVARIFLYVYVRWGNQSHAWGKSGVMESVTVLLDWMEADPVDTWELGRNDSVESITGTRNVFVDYPELAFLLFGEEIPEDMTTPSGEGDTKCGHDNFDTGVVVVATCTTGGYTLYTCKTSGCGYSYKTNVTDAKGHSYSGGICTGCGEAESSAPSNPVYATEISTGAAYKLGFLQASEDTEYYFTGTMSGYYGATDTAFENGVDVYVETSGSGYRLYFNDASGKKQYINLVLSGTHYNFTYSTTATSTFTWDTAKHAFYTTVSGEVCYMGTYGTYKTVSVLRSSLSKDTDYIARMYPTDGGNAGGGSGETPDTPCTHSYKQTVTSPTCTKGGYTTYTCSLCQDSYTGNNTSALGHNYVNDKCTRCSAAKPSSSKATISFTDTANRTEFDGNHQIWAQNGITVTNNKDGSSSDVAGYSNPARFYKSSTVIIEYNNITKLEINCEGLETKYVSPWLNAPSGATATESNGIVTVTFATPVDTVTYSNLSAQCRAYDITVYTSGEGETVCQHKWTAATCTSPKTCSLCQVTEGAALGHSWTDATCTAPKICSVCKLTEGVALGHSWKDATCTEAKTCSVCKVTEGEALGHSWKEATCTSPRTCTVCNMTESTAPGHSWIDATCTTPKTCSVCRSTEGVALGHSWKDATCTAPKTCSVCKVTEGVALGHSWTDATCTAPKICSVCKLTEGVALGHSWIDATCTTPKMCSVCNLTEGEALGHIWADATCTVPKTCSICMATEGETLDHTWTDATCTEAKTCSVCKVTEGEALGHSWKEATCTSPRTCTVCNITESAAPGHSWIDATCTTPKICSVCNSTEGKALDHDWTDATCTEAKTCSVCKVTEGEALGHTWTDATCTEAKTCSVCKVTEGEALGHTWTDATCTEAKTCSACKVTEGEALGHTWIDATCTEAKTCSVCKVTEGEALGHDWVDATTEAPKTCSRCEITEGEKLPDDNKEPDDGKEPVDGDTPAKDHSKCEAGGFKRFWRSIFNFFRRIFGMDKKCVCGEFYE